MRNLLGCLYILLGVLAPTIASAQECPTPARNVKYSDAFYRAQSYYMEQGSERSAGLSVLVQGVPIGGQMSTKDWSMEKSNITETQARSFITQELASHQAQIVSECSATLCIISRNPVTSLAQAQAVEAIARICTQAIGVGSTSGAGTKDDFKLEPEQTFVFFDSSDTTDQRTILSVKNTTTGTLDLEVYQGDLPDDFLKDLPIRFARNETKFTLKPNESALLPFYIKAPADKSNVTRADITVRAIANNQVSAISTVFIVPSRDFFQPPPRMECGSIKQNSSIRATADDGSTFEDAHVEWISLPSSQVGPNMGWKGQTAAWALLRAICDPPVVSKTSLNQAISIENEVGGVCGPNGSNTGGHGIVAPQWRTTLSLPEGEANTVWHVELKGSSEAHEVAAIPASNPLEHCTVRLMGNGIVKDFSFPRNGPSADLRVPNLKPGAYALEMSCPAIQRGCYGASRGTRCAGNAKVSLMITALRTDQKR